MRRPDLTKVQESAARLTRVLFLAAAGDDLADDARDGIAYTIQELAEAFGVDERGVEAIRSILVQSEERLDDYAAAHTDGRIMVEARQ